jgi:hypothetical protein
MVDILEPGVRQYIAVDAVNHQPLIGYRVQKAHRYAFAKNET